MSKNKQTKNLHGLIVFFFCFLLKKWTDGTALPMSLLFCGALLGSAATCGIRPMRGELG